MTNERVQKQIARGRRTRALLTQAQYSGVPMAVQVGVLAAHADGALDDLAPDRIPLLRARLPGWLRTRAGTAQSDVRSTGKLDGRTRTVLVEAVAALVRDMATSGAAP